jgi:hypothetical protein
MKNTSLKKVIITISLLIAVVYAGIVSAHDQPGELGTAAAATNLYRVTCYDLGDGSGATDHLEVDNATATTGQKVSAQFFKDGMALNITSGVDIGTKQLTGGNGDYTLLVDKSAAGPASYDIHFHCKSITGQHTGTDTTPLPNN